ncbi:MAG: FAD-dependent monooxygenase [Actinocatenispora sp.]
MRAEPTAVVVGAGIAGLATALSLHRAGWRPVVVEHAPYRRTGGYVVNFAGIGYDAAERLGLLPALRARNLVYDELRYLDDDREVRLSAATQRALLGPRALNLMRGDIEHVLHEALAGEVEIRYATTVTDIRQDPDAVHVTFSDGTRGTADLLLGADGLHSTVRRQVFGPERDHRLDLDHLIAVYELDRAPREVPPRTSVSYNVPGRQVAVAHLGDGRTIAFFAHRSTRPDAELAAGPRRTLPDVYGDLGWVVPDLLSRVPDRESIYFDMVSQIRMAAWHRGRVAVLGDAAWCVTLFAGYGSSLAVGGANRLGDMLAQLPDVPTALRAWDVELRPHVLRKQRAGRRARSLFVPADAVRLRLRQASLRVASSPLVTRVLSRRSA